jgi:MOSC domain-containing protein YiiM
MRGAATRWRWTLEGIPRSVCDTNGPSGWSALDHRAAHAEALGGSADDELADIAARWVGKNVPAETIHAGEHHLHAAGRVLHALGAGAPTSTGTVHRLHSSGGGVPKMPIDRAEVGYRGFVGDRQATRRHHGRPWQALSLWSIEVIDALAAEGHPIAPGLAGENITIAGITWSSLRPGVIIEIGDAVAQVTAWADPCSNLKPWFVDGDFGRVGHDRHPGSSRAYASVLRGGIIRPGDQVTVEPD